MPDLDQEIVTHLTDWQGRLLGYLVSILGDLHVARDALQATNLAIWQKRSEFIAGSEFGPWARKFAYFEALALIRDRKRDKLIFDEDLVAQLAQDKVELGDEDERQLALRDCVMQLPQPQRELLQQRYVDGGSVRQSMLMSGKKESAVKVSLMRIRRALLQCIESKLEADSA